MKLNFETGLCDKKWTRKWEKAKYAESFWMQVQSTIENKDHFNTVHQRFMVIHCSRGGGVIIIIIYSIENALLISGDTILPQ